MYLGTVNFKTNYF